MNPSGMAHACATVCARIKQRKRCSARECSGLHELPACASAAGGGNATGEGVTGHPPRNGSWSFAPSLYEAGRVSAFGLAVVNDGEQPARLYWVNDAGDELGYGVLMPGARVVQHSYLGHHWRLRELGGERDQPQDQIMCIE